VRVADRSRGWNRLCLHRVASVWVAIALLLGLSSGSALATAPGTNGPIVFSSYGKIFTIQPDGSGLHPVIRTDEESKYDFEPSWSPDGLRIVTSGEMQEPDSYYWTDMGLQVFSPEGTGFEHLPIFGYISAPAWSPDGTHILFDREGELFSTTPDGSVPTPIESEVGGPAWSPDGSQIVFARSVGSDVALYTMSANGGNARKLLELPGSLKTPSWSPDGSTIAFTYTGHGIYAVPAAGGNPEQLTTFATDEDPAWSPDGSMIVFQSERNSVAPDLYLMNANGSEQHRLTTTIHCLQCGPDWASLPPHPHAPAPVAGGQGAVPRRNQRLSGMSLTRMRFARPSGVWIHFRAAIAEEVDFTILRAVPPRRAFRCDREPSVCVLTGQDERQAREGFNRISLSGLLGKALAPGRYWLRLSSSSGHAHTGLAFEVMRPRDRQRRVLDR
jgi:hypothetical protein